MPARTAGRLIPALMLGVALTVAPGAALLRAQTIPLELGAIPPQDVIALAPDGVDKAVADLPDAITDILKRSGVPGAAVAVVHGGQTVFARGFGVRKIGTDARVDAQTVFQIASLSKPIAGTVAAIAVSKGLVDWNDTAIRYLPGLTLSDPYVTANATIGDFFAHRTGLPPAAGDTLEDIGFDRQSIIERLRYVPLDPFRTSYNYANFGITIGGEAVAAAAGKSWDDLADSLLFAPLGMTATSYRHADFRARPNRAVLHALEDGKFQPRYDRNPDPQAPAGGASSNVVDLAEWLKLLLANGKRGSAEIIRPDALMPALRAQAFSGPARTPDARSGFYGYGFNVVVNANGRPAMNHSGAFVLGAATNMQMIPSADVAIIVLTNGSPVGAAEAIATRFMDIVQYGAPTRDWYPLFSAMMKPYLVPEGDLVGKTPPASPAAAQPLTAYVGTYANPFFGPARIETDGDRLVLALGPADFRLLLTHWDGDTFAASPTTENTPAGSRSSVTFTLTDGKAASVRVNYLDAEGLATWTR